MAGGDMLRDIPDFRTKSKCKEDCRRRWTRTIGPQIKNLLLCQLSYTTLKARTMNRTGQISIILV